MTTTPSALACPDCGGPFECLDYSDITARSAPILDDSYAPETGHLYVRTDLDRYHCETSDEPFHLYCPQCKNQHPVPEGITVEIDD